MALVTDVAMELDFLRAVSFYKHVCHYLGAPSTVNGHELHVEATMDEVGEHRFMCVLHVQLVLEGKLLMSSFCSPVPSECDKLIERAVEYAYD